MCKQKGDMLEPGLPVWPRRPPHRATSQGEVMSRPVQTRDQDREPWRSEETHVDSPNTNTVGDWEESKPSPGSREILLNRENSRPGRTAQTKGKAENARTEEIWPVRLTCKAMVVMGRERGPQQGRRWERAGPRVHCSIPFSPRSSGRGGEGPSPPSHRGDRGSGG